MRRPEAPPPSTYQPSPPAVDKGEKDGDKKEKKAALMQWNNLVADDWRTDTAPASTYIPSPPEVEAPASLAQEDDKKLTKAEKIAQGTAKVGGDGTEGKEGKGNGNDTLPSHYQSSWHFANEHEKVHELQPKYYQDIANTNTPGMRTTFYSQHH